MAEYPNYSFPIPGEYPQKNSKENKPITSNDLELAVRTALKNTKPLKSAITYLWQPQEDGELKPAN